MSRIRLAIISDFVEEGWPSMDLFAEMLLRETGGCRLSPTYRRRLERIPVLGRSRFARNTDRLLNRHFDLPRFLRDKVRQFDCFHVVDHSYAQVIHTLPAERTGVYCHDLDTFRCLLEPTKEPRPWWFRKMAQRILTGMQRAAVVFYSTFAVREQIERYGVIEPARLVHAPCGVSDEYLVPSASEIDPNSEPFLLHVGSCIPRKRIDVLLTVFAQLRQRHPNLRLVKIGGEWSNEQRQLLEQFQLGEWIEHHVGLDRRTLASYYQRAAVVLLPSEAEGFGLPVIEALACGAVVVASDFPVLREVGGEAVIYQPVGNIPAWVDCIDRLLKAPNLAPAIAVRRQQAARFTWQAHAKTILSAYERLVDEAE